MTDKKEDSHLEKLEGEFKDFQKEWRKFLKNDFSHLVKNVNTLIQQNDAIQQKIDKMESNIIDALGARAYDWVEKKGSCGLRKKVPVKKD